MENFRNQRRNIFVGLFVVVFSLLSFFIFNIEDEHLSVSVYLPESLKQNVNDLTAALCPTVHYMAEELEDEGIEVVKASSTPDSLDYLQKGLVDFSICSRLPAPGEPEFSYQIIGDGYSFFSADGFMISEEEMEHFNFFTDLPVEDVLEKFSYISQDRIMNVEDVYEYVREGIVITDVENTDYSRANVVLVFNEEGKKLPYSWAPVLYHREVSTTK